MVHFRTIILAYVMVLLGCQQAESPTRPSDKTQSVRSQESNSSVTTMESTPIQKPGFALILPGMWSERPAAEGFDFVDQHQEEQLPVTLLEATTNLDDGELRSAVLRLVDIRRESILEMSNATARLTETESVPTDGGVAMRFEGIDRNAKVQIVTEVRGYPRRVITLAFYRYDLDDQTGFHARVSQILDSLTVGNR